MSGASVPQIARRITLRLAWPAALGSLLILFVRSIESFEVPALLGLPVGIQVYTSSIYQAIHQYPSQIGLAAAYAVTLLLHHLARHLRAVAAVAPGRAISRPSPARAFARAPSTSAAGAISRRRSSFSISS